MDSETQRAQQAESLVQRMLGISVIMQIWKDTLVKEQIERDYQNTLDSFISEPVADIFEEPLDALSSLT